jgi:uncharacterized protein (DUF983 family)
MARPPKNYFQFCIVEDCYKYGKNKGYCNHHWHKVKAYGNPLATCGGKDSICVTHPYLVAELVDKKNSLLTKGSDKKVLWRCTNGHEYRQAISSRTRGAGCSACNGGNVLIIGGNDLASKFPEVAKEALFDPTQVVAGSKQVLPWKCKECQFVWKARCSRRTEKGKATGCPRCRKPDVYPGVNDLATTHPELAAELLDQSLATQITANSSKKDVDWVCPCCSNIWRGRVSNRFRRSVPGCPSCNPHGGFKKAAPKAWVYLLFRIGQQKVGITAQLARRLADHRANGWRTIDIKRHDGATAAAIEKQYLFVIDQLGIPRGQAAFRERFDGWSESWQTVDFFAESLDTFKDKLYTEVWAKVFSLC